MKGKLIVFEGINGSGKSFLATKLKSQYLLNSIYMKFPDRNSMSGKMINKFLNKEISLSLEQSIDLFIENIKESKALIDFTLSQGVNILCDRYYISTIVYNYLEIIQTIHHTQYNNIKLTDLIDKVIDLPKPDIVFLINGNHLSMRNEKKQRYHNDNLNLLLMNNYITTLNLLNQKWILIDNTKLFNSSLILLDMINSINIL
jgi:dTMP kinase